MKILSIVTFLLALSTQAFACPENTDDVAQKNILIGYAAAQVDADLTTAKGVNVQNYKKGFTGAVGGPDCFARMFTSGTVNLSYPDPTGDRTCNVSVQVSRNVLTGGASSSFTAQSPIPQCYTNL